MEVASVTPSVPAIDYGPPHNEPMHSNTTPLPFEQLSKFLPPTIDGQFPISELLSRVVQATYAELTEFAETCACPDLISPLIPTLNSMPSMSDQARKTSIAGFCIRTKKQVAKLYAVVKWSRDAAVVQKAMVRATVY